MNRWLIGTMSAIGVASVGAGLYLGMQPSRPLFTMRGYAPTFSSSFCGALASSDKSGAWWCFEGDGGFTANSTNDGGTQTIAASGTPTQTSQRTCPNGQNCTAVAYTRLNSGDYYSLGSTVSIEGDFTVCALGRTDTAGTNRAFVASNNGTGGRPFRVLYNSSNVAYATIFNSSGTQFDVYSSAVTYSSGRPWRLLCASYDNVDGGAANNVFTLTVNGVEPSANSTASNAPVIDPASSTVSIGGYPSGGAVPIVGDIRGAFYTEKSLTTARLLQIASSLGLKPSDVLRGDMGEAMTYVRSGVAACSPHNSNASITWLDDNTPCVANGVLGLPQGTNFSLYSEQLQQAATWVPYKLNAGAYPVVSADSTYAPDGTKTADGVVFSAVRQGTSDATLLYQTGINACPSANQVCQASIYGKTQDAGTATMAMYVDDSDWNVVSDQTCTWTGEWSRCVTPPFVAAGSKTYTILLGNIGDVGASHYGPQIDVYLWGAQMERASPVVGTPYIGPTTTGTASRSVETLSFTNPLTAGAPSEYCVGATFDVLKHGGFGNWGGVCPTGGLVTLGTYNGTTFGTDYLGLTRFTYSDSNTKTYCHISGEDAGTTALLSESTNPSLLDGGVQRAVCCYRGGWPEIYTSTSGKTQNDGGSLFYQPQTSVNSTVYLNSFRADGTTSQNSSCTRIRDICIGRDVASCQ